MASRRHSARRKTVMLDGCPNRFESSCEHTILSREGGQRFGQRSSGPPPRVYPRVEKRCEMADAVRRTEYYYATVPDEPGAGARVLSQLQQAGVNLAAYLGFPSGKGQSQIDLVPENA